MTDYRDILTGYRWFVLMLVLGLLLTACGQDLARPETMQDRIAYTEGGLTAAYLTIADLKTAGRISAATRDELVKSADIPAAALDATRAAVGIGDLTTASAQLRLAQDGLRLLQATLRGFQ